MGATSETTVDGTRVTVVVGDLTRQDVDAIVNAANRHLRHGGGVAGAIAIAAGPAVQRESDAWVAEHGPLDEGGAAVTTAGDLPARHVVHVAGPVWDASRDDEPALRAAVRGALGAAVDAGARTVALPAISSGIYGYPPDDATRIIADEVVAACRDLDLDEVRLVALDAAMGERFAAGLAAAG
jgi:O-acetyl-ADP-ribose deacetylase (regulator of RNase III)